MTRPPIPLPWPRPFDLLWLAMGVEYPGLPPDDAEPIILNQGTVFEEPLTVPLAILWAERLAASELG